jgi:hypothetical protein
MHTRRSAYRLLMKLIIVLVLEKNTNNGFPGGRTGVLRGRRAYPRFAAAHDAGVAVARLALAAGLAAADAWRLARHAGRRGSPGRADDARGRVLRQHGVCRGDAAAAARDACACDARPAPEPVRAAEFQHQGVVRPAFGCAWRGGSAAVLSGSSRPGH